MMRGYATAADATRRSAIGAMGDRSRALMLRPQGRRYQVLPMGVQRLLLLLLLLVVVVVRMMLLLLLLLLLEVIRMMSGWMVVVVRGGGVPRRIARRVALVTAVGGVSVALRRDRRRRGRRRRRERRARLARRRGGLDRNQDVAGGWGRHALAGVISVREIVHDVMLLLMLLLLLLVLLVLLLLLMMMMRRRMGGGPLIDAGVHDGRQARRRPVAVDAIHGGRAAAVTCMTAVLVNRLVLLRRGGH